MRGKLAGLVAVASVTLALFLAPPPLPALALTTSPVDVSSAMRYAASAPLGTIIDGLSQEDDGTESFQAPFAVNFFGTVYGGLCVTTNGGVFLTQDTDGDDPPGAADGDWTNESCSDEYDMNLENLALEAESSMIVAMGNDQSLEECDDNTSDGFGVQCEIYYGTTTVDGQDAYAITWYRVSQYSGDNDSALSNTYQIVIIKAADWDGTSNWDFDIEFNYGQVKDVSDEDGYDVDDPGEECSDAETNCRWAIGWVNFTAGTPPTTDPYELFPNTPAAQLADGGATSLTANSLNSSVTGRYTFGQRNGVTTNFPGLNSSSSSSSEGPAGVPGIYLAVAGPVGRSVGESPIYYGTDRVAASSTYLLTVTAVPSGSRSKLSLAEGEIPLDGSLQGMVRLPVLAPGTYNVRMEGTHRNGSTLQLTSVITVGPSGVFTSIGPNIPLIK